MKIGKQTVGVEAELSAPIVYALRQAPRHKLDVVGFFDPGKAERHAGLTLMQPYQPGKIPIVFIHGLLSDPLTWTEMFNELGADPEVRNRYQFWAFFYPTGSPFLKSAAQLREELRAARQLCDPNGTDSALDQMVLVGHSMGGLMAKLQVIKSGDDFWNQVSKKPFAQIKATPDARQRLERSFFFEPLPFVRRVVFVATPHRIEVKPALVGRLGSYLVHMPAMLLTLHQQLLKDNPDTFTGVFARAFRRASIYCARQPAAQGDVPLPPPPSVRLHSVVGNYVDMGKEGPGDGVVPVKSARLAEAATEVEVP